MTICCPAVQGARAAGSARAAEGRPGATGDPEEAAGAEVAVPVQPVDVGRTGVHGAAARLPGQTHLVGILLGHHGACHLLRHLRHLHACLRLLHRH